MGLIASARLKTKVEFYTQLLVIITEFKTHIRYLGTTLNTLLKLKRKDETLLTPMLNKCCEYLNSGLPFEASLEKSLSCIPASCGLTPQEKQLVLDFGRGLGTTDTEGQITHLDMYYKIFSDKLIQVKSEQSKKSKLYKTLGLSGGVALALLII